MADRAREICRENYANMQRIGITGAFVSEELGGMGMRSMRDWNLTKVTLARTCTMSGFFGVRVNGRLIAMASERMCSPGFTRIRAA